MFRSFLDLLVLILFCTLKQCNFLLVGIVVVENSSRKESVFRHTTSWFNLRIGEVSQKTAMKISRAMVESKDQDGGQTFDCLSIQLNTFYSGPLNL